MARCRGWSTSKDVKTSKETHGLATWKLIALKMRGCSFSQMIKEIHKCQVIMLYSFNFYNVICQISVNWKKKKQENLWKRMGRKMFLGHGEDVTFISRT